VCGAGCAVAGGGKQCNDGPSEPCCSQCQYKPNPCDDNDKCTKDDICQPIESIMQKKSVCRGVSKCNTYKDVCTYEECDPKVGVCTKKTLADGAACGLTGTEPKDWNLCESRCVAGVCEFKKLSCDDQAVSMGMMLKLVDEKSCDAYGCNPKTGTCELGPKPDKPCNDGNGCTVNDKCTPDAAQGGKLVCGGDPKVCDGPAQVR
jgi:hypothetical protein